MWSIGTAVMAIVAAQPADTASQILLDPSFSLGRQWYTGLVSNLGILAWTTGVCAAAGGAWICRLGGRSSAQRFLRGGAFVGLVFLLDDLFQFHSIVLPTTLGIPKLASEVALGGAMVWWAFRQVREIRRTHFHLLIATLVGLAASLWVDTVLEPLPASGWTVVEDGTKFLGILAWATYFVVTTRDIGRSVFTQALMTWPDEAYDSVFGEGAFASQVQQPPIEGWRDDLELSAHDTTIADETTSA